MNPTIEAFLKQARIAAGKRRDAALAKAKAEIETEFTADMRAIDRMEALGSTSESGEEVNASLTPEKSKKDITGPIAAAREAIAALGDGFTANEVFEYVVQHHPAAKIKMPSIYSAITKMKKGKEIETIKKGEGRSPGTYKVASRDAQTTFDS